MDYYCDTYFDKPMLQEYNQICKQTYDAFKIRLHAFFKTPRLALVEKERYIKASQNQ